MMDQRLSTYCRSLERQKDLMAKLLGKRRDENERTRHRLIVKLCRERAKSCALRQSNWVSGEQVAGWCLTTAEAIESQTPLTYFERLADTHDSNGELKPAMEKR